MAVIGDQLTWMDYAAGVGADGKTLKIIEMMAEVNEITQDMAVVGGNTLTGHTLSIQNGIPTPTFRRINRGTPATKATEEAVEFTSGVIEDRGEVDELLVKFQKEPEMFRLKQNRGHIEGISQLLAETTVYGDVEQYPDRFTGLAAFYNDLNADSGANIVDAGGASDNCSMFLVFWADDVICGFLPQTVPSGIEHMDKGLEKCLDGDDNPLYKWVDLYRAHLGLVVADWRQAARVANINVAALDTAGAETDTSANLIRLGVKAKHCIHNKQKGRGAWYAPRIIAEALEIQAINKPNVNLSIKDLGQDNAVTMFCGYPLRTVDAMLETEAQIT